MFTKIRIIQFENNQEETKYCYHVQIKVPRLTYVLNVDLTLMFNFCGDIWGWGERRGMKNGERERGDKRGKREGPESAGRDNI